MGMERERKGKVLKDVECMEVEENRRERDEEGERE